MKHFDFLFAELAEDEGAEDSAGAEGGVDSAGLRFSSEAMESLSNLRPVPPVLAAAFSRTKNSRTLFELALSFFIFDTVSSFILALIQQLIGSFYAFVYLKIRVILSDTESHG